MIHHEFTTLGKTIRQLRQGRNISQEAFAESCGLHRTYICDVERGTRNVTIGTLLRIAHALGTTVSELTRSWENDALNPVRPALEQFPPDVQRLIGRMAHAEHPLIGAHGTDAAPHFVRPSARKESDPNGT